MGVVANAKHQGAEELLLGLGEGGIQAQAQGGEVGCRRLCAAPSLWGFPDGHLLLAAGQLGHHRAAGIHHKAGPVEHQLVVAAHLVHIDHRALQFLGGAGGQAMAQGRLGLAKGGGREIEQHIDPVRLQRGYGIGTSQAVALQFLLNPEVFADGETQRPAATSLLELQNGGLVGSSEITPFVKDVVGGQQLFAGDDAPLAT